jgi:dihydrofolate reductase
MGTVRTGMSVSVDGFIGSVGERAMDDHNTLHGWVYGLAAWRRDQGLDGGVEGPDSDVIADRAVGVGAYVMGRTMFDFGDGPWGAEPPFHAPVFVLTSRPRETDVREGGTSFTFVTGGIEEAVARAKEAAGDRDVVVSGGGSAVHQALAAGLLDEVQMHVRPVLLGDGVRLFDQVEPRQLALQCTQVQAGDGVTHLTYQIVK